jgi:RimJ/RimL family protein N-acetyltransferase
MKLKKLMEKFNSRAINFGVKVRSVEEIDAEKILQLRTNEKLSKHLHKTEDDITKQRKYIQSYKEREAQGVEYYFAFSLIDGINPIGFYRIHNIDYLKKSFSIGSWIFEQNESDNTPIIADVLSKEFGFDILGLETCYFDVRRNNTKVLKYHMIFCPKFIREDEEENNYFVLTKTNYIENREIIIKYLT